MILRNPQNTCSARVTGNPEVSLRNRANRPYGIYEIDYSSGGSYQGMAAPNENLLEARELRKRPCFPAMGTEPAPHD